MSSIFGAFRLEKCSNIQREIEKKVISSWNKAYGSDNYGICDFSNGFIGCYIERLNIDQSKSKTIFKSNNKIAVIDAVLYNRKEIAQKMDIVLSDSISDEELIFDYLLKFGIEALENVNGDFAGAIYCESQKRITLFRDHMGIRPLFYYKDDNLFIFSTDIRGITAIQSVDSSISERWIFTMMSGHFVYDPERTEYENIFCLKPGSYMKVIFDNGKFVLNSKEYFTFGKSKIKIRSDEEYQIYLRNLIEDSVKRRLDSVSGLVGAELSGGLDSGVIDILINRFRRKCIYYSWSRSPEEVDIVENDERLVINDICDQENIICNYGDFGFENYHMMDKKIRETGLKINYDEEAGLRYALPSYINSPSLVYASEFMHENGASVIFSGHGGDEGVSHRSDPFEMLYYKEFYHYLRYMFSTTHGEKARIIRSLKKIYLNIQNAKKKHLKRSIGNLNAYELLRNDFCEKYGTEYLPLRYFVYDPISYINHGGSRLRLDNAAVLGAYSGCRYIFPYMDYRVMDFAVSIPRYQYLRGRKNRYIFRESFKDIMPLSLYRQKCKEDVSNRNITPDPNAYDNLRKTWKEVSSILDRNFWNKYLRFDIIDELSDKPELSEKEKEVMNKCVYNLYLCAMAQNMVEKSREIEY